MSEIRHVRGHLFQRALPIDNLTQVTLQMTEPETPLSPQSNAEVDSTQILDALRSMLPLGKGKIGQEFTEDVGRKVNRLAINLQKEPDETIAFQCLALIGLAIAKGNKEAAKRKPRPVRWVNAAPPSMQTLRSDNERLGAVKLLAPLKASWVIGYALREAADAKTSKMLANELVKWASVASATHADLVKSLSIIIRANQTISSDRIVQVLKLSTKWLPSSEVEAGAHFAEEFSDLASAIADFGRGMSSSPKTVLEMQEVALSLLEVISTREPAVLLDQTTLRGLAILSKLPGGWPKSLQKHLPSIGRRMVSMALQQIKMHGLNDCVDVRRLLAFASHFLPIEKVSSRFLADREIIKSLFAPIQEAPLGGSVEVSVNSGIQEQVAALLVAWHHYRSGLSEPTGANEVGSLVALVASKAKVETFGSKGDVVPFQPLQHFLGDTSTPPPTNVRIEIPGVRAVRSDESHRVLTRALVYPAN